MLLRSALHIRAAAAVIGGTAVGLIVWASGMMDRSYALAAEKCPPLPDNYVPEIGWIISMAPAALAVPLVLLAVLIAVRHPSASSGLVIIALIALALSGGLSLLTSAAGCPAIT